MPRNMTRKQKRTTFIGAGMIVFFLMIMILLLPLRVWSSFAASDTDLSATAMALNVNSNDPFTQFCNSFYHVTATTLSSGPLDKYNECLALGPGFQSYLQSRSFTYGSTSYGVTATGTVGGTATDTAGSTPTNTSTVQPLCTCVPIATPTSVDTGVTPTSVNTGATPTVTSTSAAWPTASLVALEFPADASKTGNAVPSADAAHVENDLTSYLQRQMTSSGTVTAIATSQVASQETDAQQNNSQAALNNWTSDPLLSLALVTYTSASDQAQFADATDSHPSFTDLSTFIMNDPIEVARIQSDLARSVKSNTYKPTGVDCSFTAPIIQSYQSCLGTDTLFDVLYAERYSGTNTTVLYNSVAAILEKEFTGEVNTYVRTNAAETDAQDAQRAYTFIAGLTDQVMKVTIIDHMFSNVVKDVQTTLCPAPIGSQTPLAISTSIGQTAVATSTSSVLTPVVTATPCVSPTGTSVPLTPVETPAATSTSISQTPVPSTTPCTGPVIQVQTPEPSVTSCDGPVSGSQTPEPTKTPCATPTDVSQTAGKSRA